MSDSRRTGTTRTNGREKTTESHKMVEKGRKKNQFSFTTRLDGVTDILSYGGYKVLFSRLVADDDSTIVPFLSGLDVAKEPLKRLDKSGTGP